MHHGQTRSPPPRLISALAASGGSMPSPDLSKEEKLDVANKAREEVKQLLSLAKEGSVNGVRK